MHITYTSISQGGAPINALSFVGLASIVLIALADTGLIYKLPGICCSVNYSRLT